MSIILAKAETMKQGDKQEKPFPSLEEFEAELARISGEQNSVKVKLAIRRALPLFAKLGNPVEATDRLSAILRKHNVNRIAPGWQYLNERIRQAIKHGGGTLKHGGSRDMKPRVQPKPKRREPKFQPGFEPGMLGKLGAAASKALGGKAQKRKIGPFGQRARRRLL